MMRTKTDSLGHILFHPGWILVSLVGIYFFFFVLDRGGVNVFFWSGGSFLLLQLVRGNYAIKNLVPNGLLLIGICLGLVLMSLLFSYAQTDSHRVFRILKMLVIVLCIHFISQSGATRHAYALFGALLAVSIAWQFAARSLFGLPYGTWSNPHYLANFSILTLPLVFYYFRTSPKPYCFIFALLLIMDIEPVLTNTSRPAFLALVASTLFVVIFFTHSRHRWIGLLAVGAGLMALGITNYAGFFDKTRELITSLSNEERVHIWSYSLKMLQDSPPLGWVVGNGIGSSADVLPKYAIPDPVYKDFNFPHNFFIQVLYDNGIIGMVLVFGGLSLLLYLFVKLARTTADASVRLFITCMMAVFLNCLIFTNLTVGFYSKYTLYPLGFIIGTLLALAHEVRNEP